MPRRKFSPFVSSRDFDFLSALYSSKRSMFNILMLLGSDKQGAQHYLMFGVRYPRDDDGAKGIIKNDIFDCLNYVS